MFCGCGLLGSAHAATSARRPTKVGGKTVKTIDVHAHCVFHEAASLVGGDAAIMNPTVGGAAEGFIQVEQRLKAMDAQKVDRKVLSINPFWYGKDRDLGVQIVKIRYYVAPATTR